MCYLSCCQVHLLREGILGGSRDDFAHCYCRQSPIEFIEFSSQSLLNSVLSL